MNKKELKFQLKILTVIVFSIFLSTMATKTVFLGYSPRINKSFVTNIVKIPLNFVLGARNGLAKYIRDNQKPSLNQKQEESLKKLEELPVTAMQKISKNSYAYSDKETGVNYVRLTGETPDYVEKTVMFEGYQIKVQLPK